MIKNSQYNLHKIEKLLQAHGIKIRYVKGLFISNACLIKNKKYLIINKFSSLEKKIDIMLGFIPSLNLASKEKRKYKKLLFPDES